MVASAIARSHWDVTQCFDTPGARWRSGGAFCDDAWHVDQDSDPYQSTAMPGWTNGQFMAFADLTGTVETSPGNWANIYKIKEYWIRKAGAMVPTPLRIYEVPQVVPYPSATPEALPIMKPATVPLPKPWRRALPNPGDQPATRPQPNPHPRPNPQPRPYPLPSLPFPIVVWPPAVPWPPGNPRPVVGPETIVEVSPGGAPAIVTRPNTSPTPSRPPRPPEKEAGKKKATVPGAPGYPVVNAIFGGKELVDNIDKSLPEELQSDPDATPFEKAQNIYDNADALDPAKIVNMIINEKIEDSIYGLKGAGAGKVNRATGAATGAGNALDPTNAGAPVPQVEFNDDGTATLTIGGEPVATLYPNG